MEKSTAFGIHIYDVFYCKKQRLSSFIVTTSSAVQGRQREKETEFIRESGTIGDWERMESEVNQEPLRGV